MKNIILMRHAKSGWNEPVTDKDRALEERGISDANLISKKVISFLPSPLQVFCSAAKRTTQTAKIFVENGVFSIEKCTFLDQLYTFDGFHLEKTIEIIAEGYDNVMIFGHNGAITDFVNKFGDIYIENVPTAGIVWIAFENDSWQNSMKGKTIKTLFPKDLR